MSGAWAKGANKAVSTAPSEDGFTTVGPGSRSGKSSLSAAAAASNNRNRPNNAGGKHSQSNNNRRSNNGGSNGYNNESEGRSGGRGGRGRGGRGGRGRGGGRNSNNNHNNDHRKSNSGGGGNRRSSQASTGNNTNQHEGRTERIIIKDAQLLQPGMGSTPAQQAVKRINAKDFILLRTQYLEPDETRFNPHKECHWTDDDREEIIQALCSKVMELGDVSKLNKKTSHETAPPLEDCKPLEVNEETRWKSKAMKHQTSTVNVDGKDDEPPETEDEVIAKALLILNKISWTTLDKLTIKFLEQTNLKENDSIRHKVIDILIQKAQTEQHFGAMYAQLCAIISKQFKQFKKDLLEQCQMEFDMDTADKIKEATEGITDPDEIEYHSTLIRKATIGHIKFLGELYLRDVVKLSITMHCLDQLLKDDKDEESLECFAHLMTTMGEKLDGHAKQNNKPFDWEKVQKIRNSTEISSRIKFLLQDLLELKERGWVQRRKTEAAKSLADLHKDLQKEEEQQASTNRRASTNSQPGLRRATSLAAAATATTDEEGFTQIQRGSMKKVRSNKNFTSSSGLPGKPKAQELRRASSQPVSMDYMGSQSPTKSKDAFSKASTPPSLPSIVSPPHQQDVLSPEECSNKMKNVLKEYFVGGDTADAALSVHEMVLVGTDGSVDRGAKAVEGGTLMVMEMKDGDVKKFLTLMESCMKDSKIEKEAVVQGLNDPLEFLSDIEIDAPFAGGHLALIISELLKWGAVDFSFLLSAPEYFRTDGKPAAFAIRILKKQGNVPSDNDLAVIEKLMTDEDKKTHDNAKSMFDAIK